MATIVGGRTKFERMKALQRENDFLLHRLEVTRKMNEDLEYKLVRLQFRKEWAMAAVQTLRRRITYVLDSLLSQRLAISGGNRAPKFGFNILMSQCRECRGSGGSMIGEDECEELGLFYSEYSPQYHDPNRGYEYWCEACIGTGNSLSNDSYI